MLLIRVMLLVCGNVQFYTINARAEFDHYLFELSLIFVCFLWNSKRKARPTVDGARLMCKSKQANLALSWLFISKVHLSMLISNHSAFGQVCFRWWSMLYLDFDIFFRPVTLDLLCFYRVRCIKRDKNSVLTEPVMLICWLLYISMNLVCAKRPERDGSFINSSDLSSWPSPDHSRLWEASTGLSDSGMDVHNWTLVFPCGIINYFWFELNHDHVVPVGQVRIVTVLRDWSSFLRLTVMLKANTPSIGV